MTAVYHFTDTARLPWILSTGELRPGRNAIGKFPSPDFLWATTSDKGDPTAAAGKRAWREGMTRLVRFTLAAEDFEPWPTVYSRFPQWTPDQVQSLEMTALASGSSPSRWLCRVDPLPADKWLSIETRTYRGRWQAFDHREIAMLMADDQGARQVQQAPPEGDPGEARAVVIGDMVYASVRTIVSSRGAYAYKVFEPRRCR
jgi:hypothetical protein